MTSQVEKTDANEVRMSLTSADVLGGRMEQLKELFPEAFVEGEIDFDRLRNALGDFVGEGRERYGHSWAGKADAIRAIQSPSVGTLVPCPEESVNFDTTENLFIEGDNLEVLKLLQKSYYGKVKMIYIDPPYNTGNEFIYPDNFREGLEDYLKYSGQTGEGGIKLSTSTETSGRYHSKWLSMIYPRLFLARNLLRVDGVLFASIDDHEVFAFKMLLDEIFGEENFIAQLVLQVNPRGRHLDRFIARTHEYVLVYARESLQHNVMVPLEKEGKMLTEYNKEDSQGKYRLLELRNRNPAFNSRTRPNLYFAIWANPTTGEVALERTATHTTEVWPKNSTGEDSCWTWNPDKVAQDKQLLVAKESSNGGWRVFRKDYLLKDDGSVAGTLPKSLWLDKEVNHDYGKKAIQDLFGENVMDFPKSAGMIQRLVRTGTGSTDIVMDFFAGSAPTAEAVIQQNLEDGGTRKFIMVQLPEPLPEDAPARKHKCSTIADIGQERVRRFIEKVAADEASRELVDEPVETDLGFRYLRLTASNFRTWDGTDKTGSTELAEQLKLFANHLEADRTEQSILYELMLRAGLSLTSEIREQTVEGQKVYSIADGLLAICLANPVSQESLRGIIELAPQRVICLDAAFGGNDQLKTNTVLEMKSHGIEFRTV